ncbi:DNA cytosine methyltransferase [Kribbella sp. NPDC054772]
MLTMTDLFCGAGGSSTGAIQVPGVKVRMAANHWNLAIAVHNLNHPNTDHSHADLHKENPRYFPKTDILWASPECTKWSQANGKVLPKIEKGLFEEPESAEAAQRSRLLMFDVLKFAEYHQYQAMIIENVVDIAVQAKYRTAWYVWRQDLMKLGYKFRVVSLNSMHAQAFGSPAPQSRDRIYIVCWKPGTPMPDVERVLRPKAYCPNCDVIAESRQAFKPGKTVGRYRQAYVYVHANCGTEVEPGWLPAAHAIDWTIPGEIIGDRLQPKTRARIAQGIARYWGQVLAVPVEAREGKQAQPVDWPMRTQTTRQETAVVAPFIAEMYGTSTARPVSEPAGTFTAGGNHHGLVTPSGGTWNEDARPTSEALRTLTTRDAYSLVTPYYGNADHAMPTNQPVGTLTTVDRYALVHRNNTGGAEMTTPVTEYMRTLTTAGHQSLIQTGPRGGRPKVSPSDLKAAEDMVPECYFRMFKPHEVAAGMAFPRDYDWTVLDEKGKPPSNRNLVKMAGNAVTPPSARDLISAVAESLGHEIPDHTTRALDLAEGVAA